MCMIRITLHHKIPDRKLFINTDASNAGWGATYKRSIGPQHVSKFSLKSMQLSSLTQYTQHREFSNELKDPRVLTPLANNSTFFEM